MFVGVDSDQEVIWVVISDMGVYTQLLSVVCNPRLRLFIGGSIWANPICYRGPVVPCSLCSCGAVLQFVSSTVSCTN